jgi:hypothetical protein
MLIGLLSDTHGRADVTAVAVRQLQSRGASFFLHCGDVGSTQVLDHLAGLAAAFVWGNCDFDRMSLERYGARLGIACYGPFGDLKLDGKRFALIHGDDHRLKQRLLSGQQHDYLCQGHTHVHQDAHVGRVRLINPGALCRANPKTVALLDTDVDRVEFLIVG